MKQIINYLEDLGFEDADTNFLFLKYLITSDKYDVMSGLTLQQFEDIKIIINQKNIYYEPK